MKTAHVQHFLIAITEFVLGCANVAKSGNCNDDTQAMTPPSPRNLDEQICFTLYAASMAVTRLYKPMLDRMGITYPQYLVLTALGETDGLTIGAIAERLTLESSTITPPVKRMELAGLVDRRRNREDERQVQVFLTDRGRALLGDSRCLGDELVRRSGMTGDAVQKLNRRIQSFLGAINAEAAREEVDE
jgi:DNA-binding MarR family transcriptional regulator